MTFKKLAEKIFISWVKYNSEGDICECLHGAELHNGLGACQGENCTCKSFN